VSRTPVVSIIDDDESIRNTMSSLVRSLGYDALTFDSAEAFLASPRLDETSCLILDVQMSGMSGLDLQDELRTCNYTVPIIFITAFPDEALRHRAEAAGALGFFGKPVDGQIIIACLNKAVQKS
jgi:FixJ family two-component response regulator